MQDFYSALVAQMGNPTAAQALLVERQMGEYWRRNFWKEFNAHRNWKVVAMGALSCHVASERRADVLERHASALLAALVTVTGLAMIGALAVALWLL